MSYSFGEIDSWKYMSTHLWSPSDVYVLQLSIGGATVKDPEDALLFVRAAGQGQNLRLDVRGIALKETGPSSYALGIVFAFTGSEFGVNIPFVADDADSMAKQIASDEYLRARYPALQISTPVFGRLISPADAIDHWRSQPLLWDHGLSGPKGRGGPTDTFAQPVDYSIVIGAVEDGKRAKPFLFPKGSLSPSDQGNGAVDNTLWWVLGLGVAGLIGWTIVRKG